ncbi:hypothetical protein CASFOL_027670 [Castilleja foliolosa]|uniref:RNase H type-1 domain-containing protein n=1 Tax=Castilleja foliolosa TaxID=1961234 RepID=A0ABD3CH83_9LAMI
MSINFARYIAPEIGTVNNYLVKSVSSFHRVVPFTPGAGVLEWVNGTFQLGSITIIVCGRSALTRSQPFVEMVFTISRIAKSHWLSMAKTGLGCSKPVRDWRPPPEDWIKFNVDAAFANGVAVTGLVFRNSNGSIVHAAAHKHVCLDPASAESLAILDACVVLERLKIEKATIESDCINAISFIAVNSVNTFWTVAPIIQKIRLLRVMWKDWNFSFVPRKANGAAHELAHWASFSNFVGDIPLDCIPIAVFCDIGYPLIAHDFFKFLI